MNARIDGVVQLEKQKRRERRRREADSFRTFQKFPALQRSLSADFVGSKLENVIDHSMAAVVVEDAPDRRLTRQMKRRSASLAKADMYLGVSKELLRTCSQDINAVQAFRQTMMDRQRQIRARESGLKGKLSPAKQGARKGETVKESALRKVRLVVEGLLESSRYDLDLRGFEGAAMTPNELRVQLRSQFGLKLSVEETLALVEHLDEDKNGVIDYKEIVQKFMNPERLTIQSAETPGQNHRDHIDRFILVMERIKHAVEDTEQRMRLKRSLSKKKGWKKAISTRKLEALSEQPTDLLKEMFQNFDQNGDGKISKEEFSSLLLDELGIELWAFEVDQVFAILDPNGDGELQFSEFVFAYNNRRQFLRNLSKESAKARHQAPRRLRSPFMPSNPYDARQYLQRSPECVPGDVIQDVEPVHSPKEGREPPFKPCNPSEAQADILSKVQHPAL